MEEEKSNSLRQIENACTSLSNKGDEMIFMTVNPTTNTSYCIASKIGMDFLHRNMKIDYLEESNFVTFFNSFVKDHYGVTEANFNIHQKTIPKSAEHDKDTEFSPFDMYIFSSEQKNTSQSEPSTEIDIQSHDYEAANQKAESKSQSNTKTDSIITESARKNTTKTKKDATEKRKSSQRSEVKSSKNDTPSAKTIKLGSIETPKSTKSEVKAKASSGVVMSRSGRKVVMPKWRLEDIGDVKEIKVEPQDDEDYGLTKKTEKELGKNLIFGKEKKSSVRTKQKGVFNSKEVSGNEKIKENSVVSKESQVSQSKDSPNRVPLKVSKRKFDSSEENMPDTKRKCEKNECRDKIDQGSPDGEDEKESSDYTVEFELKVENVKKELDILKDEIEEKIEKRDEDINETVESLIYESIVGDEKDEQDNIEFKDDLEGEEEDLKNELDNDIDSKNSGIWSCGICDAKAKKCWLVRRHMRRMHDLSNKDLKPCRYCKMVKVYEECNECQEKVDDSKLTCEICEKTFTTRFQFVRHQECHLTEKEIPCNLCGKKFKSERYVKMHIYHTHKKRNGKALTTQMEPGICDICGKWFRFKCNAVRHREIHFEEKRFDCPICHMKFRHSSSLKRHKLSHQQKAEYVCEQCGRSFKMKQTLIQHHRVHVKEPFLKCEYCPREFRTYKGKKYHILKDHADKAGDFNFKSFVCEICEKASSSQAEYEEHQKTHDASRAYVCSICGSRWTTIAQLKAHKKSHNLAPHRYRCRVCNIPFKEASKARIHILKESHIKNCLAMGMDQHKDNISDITNNEIIDMIEYDYGFPEGTEQELQQELVTTAVSEMEVIPEEIKVIHIEQNDFGGSTAEVQILNEGGSEIMYDEIILPQEEITVDGEQVIYQVEIDGQNAIICDTLTSQAVESILKLQSQS